MPNDSTIIRAKLFAENKIKQTNARTLLLGDWNGIVINDAKRSTNFDEFVIGRGPDCDAILLDVNISRKHASLNFERNNRSWTITDHKSLNGVKLNGELIRAGEKYSLSHGDLVTVGPNEDYVWKFQEERISTQNDSNLQISTYDDPNFRIPKFPLEGISNNSIFKNKAEARLKEAYEKISTERKALEEKVENGQKLQESLQSEKAQLEKELTSKLEDLERQQKIERDNFEKTLSANQEENECVRKEFEQKLSNEKAEMLKRSEELESEMKRKVEEEERKLKVLLQEREKMIELLQSEKEKAEVRMEEERKNFDEKIATLEGNFKNIEKEKSQEYQEAVKKLQQEFDDKLRRGQCELEEAISREKAEKEAERVKTEKIRQEMESLSAEVAKLREEQSLKRKQSEEEQIQQNENRKKRRESVLAKCSEELKCTICDELFISPQSLNCGHVYCKYCIDQWKLKCRSGGFTCPNCRSKITSQNRSLHLENLIESLYKDVDQSIKEEREMLLNERKALILADQATAQAPATLSQQTANENAAAISRMIGAIINRQRQANPRSGPQGIITANNPRPNAPGNQRPVRSNAPVLHLPIRPTILAQVRPNSATVRPNVRIHIRAPIRITAREVRSANGCVEFHLTNTTGEVLPPNVIPQVMALVNSHLQEAQRVARLNRRPPPTEVTFEINPEILQR